MLTVQREAYTQLAAERARVNAIFAAVPVDEAAVNALPINGVPQQLLDCAIHMSEVAQPESIFSKHGYVDTADERPRGKRSFELLAVVLICFALHCFALLYFALLCFALLCSALLCFALLSFALLFIALLCIA